MMDVRFLRGLSTTFHGESFVADSKTFYYLTDTNELYLGSALLSNEITAAEFEALVKRVDDLTEWKENLPEYLTSDEFDAWLKKEYEEHLRVQDIRDDKQEDRIAALEETVEGIVSVGGEANIIEKITVDGEEVEIENKIAKIVLQDRFDEEAKARREGDAALQEQIDKIEITLPTIDTNTEYTLTHDEAKKELYLTPSEGEVQTVSLADYEYAGVAADLVEDEAKARAEGDSATLEAAMDYTDGEIKKILGDDLTETFNTLKEVQDWVDTHGEKTLDLVNNLAQERSERIAADNALGQRIDAIHTHTNKTELDSITAQDLVNWRGEVGAKALAGTKQDAIDGTTELTVKSIALEEILYNGVSILPADMTNAKVAKDTDLMALDQTVTDIISGTISVGKANKASETDYAMDAAHAADADYATEAGHAETADHATNADNATEAAHAVNATGADYAQGAAIADSVIDGCIGTVNLNEELEARIKNADTALQAHQDISHLATKEVVGVGFAAEGKTITEMITANASTCQTNFNTIVTQLTWGEF